MNIATWLHDLGLSVYEQAFRENVIELELLPQLTADDLKEMGVIPVGPRGHAKEPAFAVVTDPSRIDKACNPPESV